MADKRLAATYADDAIAAAARDDAPAERAAMQNLTEVCRRSGIAVEVLLDEAHQRRGPAVVDAS